MTKGRKPSTELAEARSIVTSGQLEAVLTDLQTTDTIKARIVKAVKFGLGIKEVQVEEKTSEVVVNEKVEE